jgi:2-polyprenyl-3-methyl-5-hydroxy-6-metoxy-1,4-benzoquinol methylase
VATALVKLGDAVAEAFRTGAGIDYGEWEPAFLEGMDRCARTRYQSHLLRSWIPALEGGPGEARSGASVADVGCGRGAALILMARAFPRSRFVGFDTHAPAIARAQAAAAESGLAERLAFEVASAVSFPGVGHDLITCFACRSMSRGEQGWG